MALAAMFGAKKSVGFDRPSIIVDTADVDDDDSSDDEMGNKQCAKLLDKALGMTRQSKFRSLVGDALQLTQQNRRASQDFTAGLLEKKIRRKTAMKSVVAKKIPKLTDVVATASDKPIVKFRRMARVVLMLIQVCNICKEMVTTGVKKEPWFALLDNIVASSNIKQKRKGPRAFVTFVPNEKRELVQLTFDVSEFKRDHKTEFILTDEVRDILSILPRSRPPEQLPKVIRCMKGLFEKFGNYPLAVQKQICQHAFYDKYRFNRVIVKKGQNPDGIYFVLSGTLIEKHDVGRQPKEIHTGSIFGENDLICGCSRRNTILTRTDTELLFLHRQDYRVIFDMSEDSNDPKNLDICKQHIVFQHFPMYRLVDNPGTWSVLKYKYGRLIAKDGNELEWIYVIKSGEARVYKYLQPGHIDVQARRKKVQAMINAQSTFYKKKKILSFVEHRDYIKSAYSPQSYHPPVRPIMSAPAGTSRDFGLSEKSHRREVSTCIPGMRSARTSISSSRRSSAFGRFDKTRDSKRNSIWSRKSGETSFESLEKSNMADSGNGEGGLNLPKLRLSEEDEECANDNDNSDKSSDREDKNKEKKEDKNEGQAVAEETTVKDIGYLSQRNGHEKEKHTRELSVIHSARDSKINGRSGQPVTKLTPRGQNTRLLSYLRTPASGTNSHPVTSQRSHQSQVGNHILPAFVQVDTLHPGQVFGLRACLDPEERGPTVSLVSGECEVLQINKKFFMKHCDDAIYSLIRLKAKPFPSQEDLIDRLDINMQWEEYKQQTIQDFLQRCSRRDR